jgi:hypothetical protein
MPIAAHPVARPTDEGNTVLNRDVNRSRVCVWWCVQTFEHACAVCESYTVQALDSAVSLHELKCKSMKKLSVLIVLKDRRAVARMAHPCLVWCVKCGCGHKSAKCDREKETRDLLTAGSESEPPTASSTWATAWPTAFLIRLSMLPTKQEPLPAAHAHAHTHTHTHTPLTKNLPDV